MAGLHTVLSTVLVLFARAANNPQVQATALKAARIATRAMIKGVAEHAKRQANFRTKHGWSN